MSPDQFNLSSSSERFPARFTTHRGCPFNLRPSWATRPLSSWYCKAKFAGLEKPTTSKSARVASTSFLHGGLPASVEASSPEFEPDEAESDDVLRDLLTWALANGVTGIGSESSKLGLFESEDGERGMIFCNVAEEGEELLSIPLRLALADHSGDEASNRDLGEGSPSDVRLAFKLLQQAKAGDASPWAPFVRALPKEIQSPFGSWPLESLAELQLEELPADLVHALNHGRDGLPHLDVTPDELRWALAVVHSRSFQCPSKESDGGVRMILPIADMFNHANDQADFLLSGPARPIDNTRWEVQQGADGSKWELVVRACRSVEAGEEALFSYGELPSWEFFLHSGFVPARNAHEAVTLFADVSEAARWFLHRFPPPPSPHSEQDGIEEIVRSVSIAAEGLIEPLSEEFASEKDAIVTHKSLQLTSKGQLDSRLVAAMTSLLENARSERPGADTVAQLVDAVAGPSGRDDAWPAAERVIGLRVAELLFQPQVTSLLADLQQLFELEDDEDERAYLAALAHHYTQVVRDFEERCPMLRLLASSASTGESQTAPPGTDLRALKAGSPECRAVLSSIATQSDTDAAEIMALKLRTLQKQVLWDGLQALIMAPA